MVGYSQVFRETLNKKSRETISCNYIIVVCLPEATQFSQVFQQKIAIKVCKLQPKVKLISF